MKQVTAQYLYDKYADKNGLISRTILDLYGWSDKDAEKAGLVIREKYRKQPHVGDRKPYEYKEGNKRDEQKRETKSNNKVFHTKNAVNKAK